MSMLHGQHKQRRDPDEETRRECDPPSESICSKSGPAVSVSSLAEGSEYMRRGRSSESTEAGEPSRLELGNQVSCMPSANIHDKTKEKRRRSRVTPMQLTQLEQFFAVDRNPTATRRKEISQALGMQDRQTQIWFQNRRAKAKNQEGKQRSRTADTQAAEDVPLLTSEYEYDNDFRRVIFEEMPVMLIPCTSLTIGTWRRMANEERHFDLVAYICESRQCLMWLLQSDGWAFKMAISFSNILDTAFVDDRPGFVILSFYLSRPPQFYSNDCCREGSCGWTSCSDWTEGCQASNNLRHDLSGETIQMARLQQYILRAMAIAFDQKPIYQHIPNPSRPSIDVLDNNKEKASMDNVKSAKTARFIAESYNYNIFQHPSYFHPNAQMRSNQSTSVEDVSPVSVILQNTVPRHRPFEAECPIGLPGSQSDARLNGQGYLNTHGVQFVMLPKNHHDYYTWSS